MKRPSKKIKAKLELLKLAEQHAFLEQRSRVVELLDIINDLDFSRLVANFMLAKEMMETALDTIKADVKEFLPDDSDF